MLSCAIVQSDTYKSDVMHREARGLAGPLHAHRTLQQQQHALLPLTCPAPLPSPPQPLVQDPKHYGLMYNVGAMPDPLAPTVPCTIFLMFQCVFAVITPSLIVGAIANRWGQHGGARVGAVGWGR